MGGYLLLSYGTAWGIWLMCGMMPPGAVTAQLLNTVVMWTPALAVWLMWLAGRRRPVLSFSMRPALRRNWKWYLAAWALSLAPQSWVRCSILAYIPGILTARFQPWRQ